LNGNDPLVSQRARIRELEAALERAGSEQERAQLGAAVAELHDSLTRLERQLAGLREDLTRLTERYDVRPDEPAGPAPALAPAAPARRGGELGGLLEQGWNCITAGDYETARQILRRALRLAPDDLEALSCLGWAQTLSRDYDGAVLTYQHVLVVSPDDVLTRLNLGFICLQKGIYGEAIEHLSRAVRSAADRRAVLYGRYYLGLVYLAREMYNDAESFFLETVDLGPTLSEAYFQLGRARCQVGRRADAVSAWKDGAAAGGFDPWARRCAEAARRVESGQPPDFDPSSPAA
jgi:tetratricopeptide (TPR) repeat protein